MLIRAEMYHYGRQTERKRKRKADDDVISPTHPEYMKGVLGDNSALLPTSDGRYGVRKERSYPRGSRGLPLQAPKIARFLV